MTDIKPNANDEEVEFGKTASELREVIRKQIIHISNKHGGKVDTDTLNSLVDDLTHVCVISLANLRKKVRSGMDATEAHRRVDKELQQLLQLAFQNPKWRTKRTQNEKDS